MAHLIIPKTGKAISMPHGLAFSDIDKDGTFSISIDTGVAYSVIALTDIAFDILDFFDRPVDENPIFIGASEDSEKTYAYFRIVSYYETASSQVVILI